MYVYDNATILQCIFNTFQIYFDHFLCLTVELKDFV